MSRVAHPTHNHSWHYWIYSTIAIPLMLLTISISLQSFHIQGQSMEPTLHDQESVLIDKISYLFRPPARGDIIVFQYPLDPQEDFVKRIIAIPGDIISVVNQTVTVNDVTLREPYISKDNAYNPFPPFSKRILGPDEYFVMGDNRSNSSDSREWGVVPRQNIIGRAVAIYWPSGENNLGFLPDVGSIFAKVHQ